MAASNWGTDCRLDEFLFRAAYEFDFFQAVRLLTLLRGEKPPAAGVAPSVVRFRVHNSLSFPASAIAEMDRMEDGLPRMSVTFLGLTGPRGALPASYTELAINRECFGDRSFADFLDVFNHRLIELFFEAWQKHHFVIGYEQARRRKDSEADEFTSYLFDLIGMGTGGLRGRMQVPDLGLLHYAGLAAQRPHSAEALRAFLHDYFGAPVSVKQFIGKWHELEPDELCCLGSGELNAQLGRGAIAGDAVWSRQAMVRIAFGPLTVDQFSSFLPDGETFAEALSLIRWFLGSTLEFEMQPTLRREEVPPCQLGDEVSAARLGWSAWLRTEPFWSDAADAVFREDELVTSGGMICH